MKRAPLEEKSTFRPEEAIAFYGLSRRRFLKLLRSKRRLPFVLQYNTRRLIVRARFEAYLRAHPEVEEELRHDKSPVPEKARQKAPGPSQR